MKWKVSIRGDNRRITRFLFFPKVIDNTAKWLEVATWNERYCPELGWWATHWIENEQPI